MIPKSLRNGILFVAQPSSLWGKQASRLRLFRQA
jgi:hypothetical protein